jgi:hypothetical protein
VVLHGDSLTILKDFPDNSIDCVCTDPPYGLSFMGKKWDYDVPSVELWREVLRVLKPGGHLLSFGGTRTYHRMVVAIEDAGFEIRDQIMWIYGSGFPKSHNIKDGSFKNWGTALKPANEPIVLARKPLEKGLTVAQNVQKWGTGALNIDGTRIGSNPGYSYPNGAGGNSFSVAKGVDGTRTTPVASTQGRWPSNCLFDEEAAAMLDEQSGPCKTGVITRPPTKDAEAIIKGKKPMITASHVDTTTGASRFFYVAKASKRERNAGMGDQTNGHPTVKPTKLMEYLIKLVCPPNGIVLDPFCGSGTTGVAANNLLVEFIGIEREAEYVVIAEKRMNNTKVS